MVIVESVALSIMVSNDIVMPLVLQRRERADQRPRECRRAAADRAPARDLRHPAARLSCITARPATRSSPPSACSSFAAIAQLAPAFFGGLIWRRATGARRHRRHDRRHSWSGPIRCCCRASPTSASSASTSSTDGPWGIALLRPQHLFGLDLPPLVHGVIWSLALNILAYIGFSLRRAALADRAPAGQPVRAVRPRADRAELPALALLGHGRGTDRHGRALSRRGAHAQRPSRASPPRHRISLEPQGRGRLPAGALRRAPARLGDRRAPRRGWCCRCCCASARSRPRRRSSCSTTPMPRSSTTAKSCRPRSTMCARASRCSTRTCS